MQVEPDLSPEAGYVLLSASIPSTLAQAVRELRMEAGLSISDWMLKDPRVRKWARIRKVKLPKPQAGPILRDRSRWLTLTEADWEKGNRHVARLLGVSRQAVAWNRKRLQAEGSLSVSHRQDKSNRSFKPQHKTT